MQNYGYIAVLIGTFLEGEVFLLIVGIFVKLNYLNPVLSWFTAILGALFHEVIYFFLGKWKGREFLLRNSYTRKKYRKAKKLIEKYGVFSIFIIRFMYGMRIVPMVFMGAVGYNTYKFLFFNVISLTIWAALYIYLGYLFGKAAEIFFGKAKEYYFTAAGIILLTATLTLLFFSFKNKLFNNKN
ncbi:DedA family protein [Hydrogenivirga sp. 128-5-R1-1]|uniref:DedA family protein n=1 Tax=Hydrogenivirga sp. 128-5-R1-1 TaxID=392423 RepID=UPI00015F0E2D|nr:DedA family protein [Hydrogenivirga sp. 128-5-R1-1]EDP74296.1 DedA [Hydrogenivirga sp. 128-5-R1-1]